MTPDKFTELLDDKLFDYMNELRDEHGASNLVINSESTYGNGTIVIKISAKEASHG
ncbi:hypothetical protein [Paenibacillus pini]|uniref:Uncharacterized protein n=1 Tax=Paenibacillus pini JCM 16418 TaxID=1236976 RepID=W7YPJ5_9BACL|nr:hypothetical protein [Paenibacillus pini]GAF10382.1 hypothetical protein JCM16418_4582 [Paenibacillus pini JCM 16418]